MIEELIVSDFDGDHTVRSLRELEERLRKRYPPHNANHLWVAGVAKHPVMAIAVRDDLACVHYVPTEGHPGFHSVGDTSRVSGSTDFYCAPDELIGMSSDAVVTFERAQQAALQFARTRSLPTSLEWCEL